MYHKVFILKKKLKKFDAINKQAHSLILKNPSYNNNTLIFYCKMKNLKIQKIENEKFKIQN